MALGGPNIFPSVLSWLGVARELTAGVTVPTSGTLNFPAVGTATIPLAQNTFNPEDMPKFLEDKAIRGAMTDIFYETIGVVNSSFNFGGPGFLDSHLLFFDNVFGDTSSIANTASSSAAFGAPVTLSSPTAIGATTATVSASTGFSIYTTGASVATGMAAQIDGVLATSEIVMVTSTASTTLGFGNSPLRFPHTAGTVIYPIAPGTAPTYTHTFAALNSPLGYGGAYGAQPPTHTINDNYNLVTVFPSGGATVNSSGTRQYASGCMSALDISGNAEQLFEIKTTGEGFLSTAATTSPPNVVTNIRPIPNWSTKLYLGGTAASNQVFDIGEFNISFKRQLTSYWTVQGLQSPYVIGRGPLNCTGTIKWSVAIDESALYYMLQNTQPFLQIQVSNGIVPNPPGTGLLSLTFTTHAAAFIKSKPDRSKTLIGFDDNFSCVATSSDAGGSGGLGPATVQIVNAIPTV